MLTVSDLKVDIQGSRILDGIDLTVNPGELVCLMGRNGAGKTTTFRTIMGYRRPVSGRIMFDGTDITGLATWRIAQKGIGFSPEESEVYADLTVAENIELATWTRPQGRPAQERLEYAYRVFPKLRQYLARGGAQLSGGERNRVNLAKMLKSGGNVILLDEPSNDLDVNTLRALEDALESFAGTVLVISHDRWFLDRIATHILAFEGDSEVVWFPGNYSEYAEDRRRRLGPVADRPHRITYRKLRRA